MGLIKCNIHRDCFANQAGRCVCLKDNHFDRGKLDCPFYKNNSEISMKKIVADCKAYIDNHAGINTEAMCA